jgi:hypothetical protein
MADKDWPRTFDDPIPLPGDGELRTLPATTLQACRSASTVRQYGTRP